MSTICGHDRAAVKSVLRSIQEYETFGFKNEPTPEQFYRTCSDPAWSVDQTEAIRRAAIDPTKLAEMLAERGRELGLAFWHGPNEPREPSPTDCVLYVIDGVIRLYSPLSPKAWQRQYALPQARAILLQWLQLSDCDQVGAEQALRDAQ